MHFTAVMSFACVVHFRAVINLYFCSFSKPGGKSEPKEQREERKVSVCHKNGSTFTIKRWKLDNLINQYMFTVCFKTQISVNNHFNISKTSE